MTLSSIDPEGKIKYKKENNQMPKHNHIYAFNYDFNEYSLCKLESKYTFNEAEKNKFLFSNLKIEPSSSAFIKKRLDIVTWSEDYDELIRQVKHENFCIERFKVEFLILHGDSTESPQRLQKCRDIGMSINGEPDYYNPTTIYSLCFYNGAWNFGELIKNSFQWHNHKEKPNSFSNSITMSIGKSLVNIATKSNKEAKLLDACSGVGTILLEGCFKDSIFLVQILMRKPVVTLEKI
jgi:hypothetical protein